MIGGVDGAFVEKYVDVYIQGLLDILRCFTSSLPLLISWVVSVLFLAQEN
jgi:uncharacterized membrane protein